MNIYSSRLCLHPLNHNHDTKEAFMDHSVPVFLSACFNPWQFFQCVTGTKRNDQPARRGHAHKHVYFVWKMFVTPTTITNRPCQTLYTTVPISVYYKKAYFLLWLTATEHISFVQFVYCTRTEAHIPTPSIPTVQYYSSQITTYVDCNSMKT